MKEVKRVDRAVNDATLNQAGNVYQYLVALKDCYELMEGDTLQIEVNGDVSVINKNQGRYQKEVKHHFGEKNLSDRDIEFWKTLANWYTDYERLKGFSNFILSTTSIITTDSPFSKWNELDKHEKLACITEIGAEHKEREETFRKQYNRIFCDSFDKNQLLDTLEKFIIAPAQTSIQGISKEFTKFVGHIPEENRDYYIGALVGNIIMQVKNPPHIWQITKTEFEELLQKETAGHCSPGNIPLPTVYSNAEIPTEEIAALQQKKFVEAIRDIDYERKVTEAISDYWKTDITIAKYFKNNFLYLQSIDEYKNTLSARLQCEKDDSEIEAEGVDEVTQIKISKHLYNRVMLWNADDFGSIIRNQDFFQHGVIHNIVDETEFNWKVGDENEH